MKVYRVVPDCFFTNERINNNDKVSVEALYYRMGYTSFSNKIGKHDFNNLDCKAKQGKYFYLFAEDAIQQGYYLINNYHRLKTNTCLIIEYDIPEDIIIKNIGYGNYSYDIRNILLTETFIEKDDFGNSITTSSQIDENKKTRYLLEAFKNSQNIIKEYRYSAYSDMAFYEEYFSDYGISDLSEDEKLKSALLDSALYNTFLNQHCELISSSYITGIILPLNMEFISTELDDWNKVSEYYQKLGIQCSYSKEHQDYKTELLYNISTTNQTKDEIKKLLKERK